MESSFVFVTTFVASDSFQGLSYISIGHSRLLRAGNIIFVGGDTILCSVQAVQGWVLCCIQVFNHFDLGCVLCFQAF